MSPRLIATIRVTSDFAKAFRKLPPRLQTLAEKKDRWFRANAHDCRLGTHKLKGALAGYWSYVINPQYRVLFRFLAGDEGLYYDVGTHKVYR